MDAVGKASAKLILFGEHAAVYGHPAVGIALPEEITVRLSGRPSAEWDLDSVAESDRGTIRRVLDRLEELLPELGARGRCRVALESSIPRGAGFGSSAALCSAFARAGLARLHGAAAPAADGAQAEDPWRLAHGMERIFHGTPSGIDTGLSLHPGLSAFFPRPPALPERERLPGIDLFLVVGAAPRADDAAGLIAGLRERMRSGDAGVRESLDALGRIAREARGILQGASAGALPLLASLVEEAMARLRSLGLSTPALDELLREGKSAGALGGKLSGAGGGGAFFLVMPGEKSAEAAARLLASVALRRGMPLVSAPRLVVVRQDSSR